MHVDIDSEYRCWLGEASAEESRVFVQALDEATGPLGRPRYLLPRWVITGPPTGLRALRASSGRLQPDGVV